MTESTFYMRSLSKFSPILYTLTIILFLSCCQETKDSSAQKYNIDQEHCLGLCPTTKKDNIIIERPIYILSNNSETKFADWVAYKVKPSSIGPSKARTWYVDPKLNPNDTLEPSDFSGAYSKLGTDRGHQVPLASFTNTKYWHQTNYLSNITPQRSSLNRGVWKELEQKVRDLTIDRHRYTWVLSGPVYEYYFGELPEADEEHQIPSGYWKIISILVDDKVQTASFFFDQETARDAELCNYLTSINTIEEKTDINILSDFNKRDIDHNSNLIEYLGCEDQW